MADTKKETEQEEELIDFLSDEDLDIPEEEIELNDPDERIELLVAQRDEFRDRFMRALADAENARKRGDRDRRGERELQRRHGRR